MYILILISVIIIILLLVIWKFDKNRHETDGPQSSGEIGFPSTGGLWSSATHRQSKEITFDIRVPSCHPYPPDREAARAWAAILLQRDDWVIVDTETTGLDESAEVIEIAIMAPSGATILHEQVRPARSISREATAVHGITKAQLRNAPLWPTVHQHVIAALADKTVIAFSSRFHERMISQTAQHYGLVLPSECWECAMEQFSQYYGERWEDGGYKHQKLPRPDKRIVRSALTDCGLTLGLIRSMGHGYDIQAAIEGARKILSGKARNQLFSEHFRCQNAIRSNYAQRDAVAGALDAAIAACEQQIALAPQVADAFCTEYADQPLPHHAGYEQLVIIRAKQQRFAEAISLSRQAVSQGWAGEWDKRIARYEKQAARQKPQITE